MLQRYDGEAATVTEIKDEEESNDDRYSAAPVIVISPDDEDYDRNAPDEISSDDQEANQSRKVTPRAPRPEETPSTLLTGNRSGLPTPN